MARYTDIDKLIAEYDRVHVGPAGGARKLIVEAPIADVVEVVRCKDCLFATKGFDEFDIYCKLNDVSFGKDAYCSYGKRREE